MCCHGELRKTRKTKYIDWIQIFGFCLLQVSGKNVHRFTQLHPELRQTQTRSYQCYLNYTLNLTIHSQVDFQLIQWGSLVIITAGKVYMPTLRHWAPPSTDFHPSQPPCSSPHHQIIRSLKLRWPWIAWKTANSRWDKGPVSFFYVNAKVSKRKNANDLTRQQRRWNVS